MSFLDVIRKDQAKIFGNLQDLAEEIEYRDGEDESFLVHAFIERESIEAKTPAGHGASVGRESVRVWLSQDAVDGRAIQPVVGVDSVYIRWRRDDATAEKFIVAGILPDSEGAWHLDCMK